MGWLLHLSAISLRYVNRDGLALQLSPCRRYLLHRILNGNPHNRVLHLDRVIPQRRERLILVYRLHQRSIPSVELLQLIRVISKLIHLRISNKPRLLRQLYPVFCKSFTMRLKRLLVPVS